MAHPTHASHTTWTRPTASSPTRAEDHRRTATFSDTRWYTTDKVRPPDHRKPPKQAQFPDAVGRASMYASKLVMSRSAIRVRSSARLMPVHKQHTLHSRSPWRSSRRLATVGQH